MRDGACQSVHTVGVQPDRLHSVPGAASPDIELAARLRLVVARLARQMRQQTMGGLTASQLSALQSVEKLEPVRLSDLAAREAVAPPTLTRIVAGLVDLGLVERRGDPEDARATLVALSADGRHALSTIWEERTAILVGRITRLPAGERALLPAVVSALEDLADRPT